MASKSHHAGFAIALGIALGAVAGVMAGHIAIWLGIGIVIGMLLGATVHGRETACPQCAIVHQQHGTTNEQAKSLELTAKS
ncbi:MAG: hypothetical protein WCF22_08560 [Candidatus Sulfotelmatobacter sp.]